MEEFFFTDSLSLIATTFLLLFFFIRSYVTNVLFLFTSLACRYSRFHLAITHIVFEWQQKNTLSFLLYMLTSLETERKEHFTVLFRDSIFNREKKALSFADNRQEKITRERKIEKGSSGVIKRDILLTFSR
jgi:hypothetical protein